MAVKLDYYKLLGIAPNSDSEAIKNGVRKSMREWRKRTEASDLAVRQEAELKVALIEEARQVLTNPAQRQAYDAQLQREGVAPQQNASPNAGNGDWLAQANHFLGIGDYHSAGYAAREATQAMGNSAESWWIRSRANAGLERFEDAIYEAQQAVNIESANPNYHFHLGFVAENLNRADQAIREYQAASTIDPQNPMYQLSIGSVLLDIGNPTEALKVIEPVYLANQMDETANFYLAMTLAELAERIPSHREGENYMVTSQEEVDQMRNYVSRIKSLQNPPAETGEFISDIETYLQRMESRRFHIPFGDAKFSGAIGSAFRTVLLLVFLLVLGIVSINAGGGTGVLIFLLMIAFGAGVVFLTFVPQWKVNSRLLKYRQV